MGGSQSSAVRAPQSSRSALFDDQSSKLVILWANPWRGRAARTAHADRTAFGRIGSHPRDRGAYRAR